jgi:hypothetical protein
MANFMRALLLFHISSIGFLFQIFFVVIVAPRSWTITNRACPSAVGPIHLLIVAMIRKEYQSTAMDAIDCPRGWGDGLHGRWIKIILFRSSARLTVTVFMIHNSVAIWFYLFSAVWKPRIGDVAPQLVPIAIGILTIGLLPLIFVYFFYG